MNNKTRKLRNHFIEQGKFELAQAVVEFDEAIERNSHLIQNISAYTNGLTCPECKKHYTNFNEIDFLLDSPMCMGCENAYSDYVQSMSMEYEHATPSDGEDAVLNFGVSL